MHWEVVLLSIVDCQNVKSPSDMSILKTAVLTINNIANSWKTSRKWWEIMFLPITYNP